MNDAVHRSVRHATRLIRAGRMQEALGALRERHATTHA